MPSNKSRIRRSCPPKPSLRDRSLFSPEQAAGLAGMFKLLANDNRLRLLHALARNGEVPVSELAAMVDMSLQATSNQLQRLADQKVIARRRDGNAIYYFVADPCVIALLDKATCLLEDAEAADS